MTRRSGGAPAFDALARAKQLEAFADRAVAPLFLGLVKQLVSAGVDIGKPGSGHRRMGKGNQAHRSRDHPVKPDDLAGDQDRRDAVGLNSSSVHHDFVVGSDSLDVYGITTRGDEQPLLLGGEWA